jgi:hypothetical protein
MHSNAVFYFQMQVPLFVLFRSSNLDEAGLKTKWQAIDKSTEAASTVNGLAGNGDVAQMVASCTAKLMATHMVENVKVAGQDLTRLYFSAATMTNVLVLVELSFKQGFQGCKCVIRTDKPQYAAVMRAAIEQVLKL